jgi:hypothetical protein
LFLADVKAIGHPVREQIDIAEGMGIQTFYILHRNCNKAIFKNWNNPTCHNRLTCLILSTSEVIVTNGERLSPFLSSVICY